MEIVLFITLLGILLDVYEKYDMMVLMKGDTLPSLDGTMREALLSRSEVLLKLF